MRDPETRTPRLSKPGSPAAERPAPVPPRRGADGLSRFLAARREGAYAVLRVVAGILFFCHGIQKLFGAFADAPKPVGTEAWFGGVIETLAGILIVAGLRTTWAAIIACGEMAVAYTQFHWKLAFSQSFFPIVNKGELAVLYCFLFLFIACRGAGRWSVDAVRLESRP
ncbi:MAG TPA: DoxX family protein [Thermoanaerobaculia bacterium]